MNQSVHSNRPRRIQRKRTKDWRLPENTVCVSRPSKWGNPFKVGQLFSDGDGCNRVDDKPHAVRLYSCWLRYTAPGREIMDVARVELRGKNLACFCSEGEPCHADVLLEIANEPQVLAGE